MDFIEPCFGIGHNLSLICQMTSEDIKHQLIIINTASARCDPINFMAFVLFHCDCVGVYPCPETDSQGLQITSHFSFPFNSDKGTGIALYIYISASKTCSLYQAVWRPCKEAWACCGRWASGLTERPGRVAGGRRAALQRGLSVLWP